MNQMYRMLHHWPLTTGPIVNAASREPPSLPPLKFMPVSSPAAFTAVLASAPDGVAPVIMTSGIESEEARFK